MSDIAGNMKKLLTLLAFLVIIGCIPGCQTKKQQTERPPNIIFLLADDQRADAFGFIGNTAIITPHLDQLALESTVFENAYHVAPICQPSRASIMTGQYLGTHGAGFDAPTNFIITKQEFEQSYPVLLHQQGYYTGFIGKFGFAVGKEEKVRNEGFESKEEYMPSLYFDSWMGFPGQGRYDPEQGKFNGYENKYESTHLTAFMGHQAIDFLRAAKKNDKPFCLSVSFKAPHAPYLPAENFRNRYNGVQIPRMINDAPEYHRNLPAVVREKSRDARWYFGRTKGYYGEDTGYRRDWHIERDSIYQEFIKNYYALITGIDHVIGQIRSELRKLDLHQNTIIIYTSDNGHFAGSRQLMGKDLLYEESIKAPLIVYDPRIPGKEQGKHEKALVSTIDIAPTLLDIAGGPIPENYPGKSFLPLTRGIKASIHEAVYGENNFDNFYPTLNQVKTPENYQSVRSRYVRTPHYKYIRYHENHPVTEELFDVANDPLETKNLIHHPDYTQVAREMSARLDEFENQYVKFHIVPAGR